MKASILLQRYRFAWDSGLLIAGNGLAGLFLLLTHVVLGRLMGGVDYAVLVALLGVLNVLSVPANTVNLTIARFTAEYAQADAVAMWVTLMKRASFRIAVVGLGILFLWCLISKSVQGLVNAPDALSVCVLGGIAFIGLFGPVFQGVLQGSKRFEWMALAILAGPVSRLILAPLFVLAGGAINSVLAAIALSALIAVIIAALPLRRSILARTPPVAGFDISPMYQYFWPVLISQGALFVLMNGDLILSARFLADENLAAYGKAAMLARAVILLPLPVAWAMFPRAVASDNMRLLVGPMLFSIAVLVGAALVVTIVPALPMRLMYGVSGPLYLHLLQLYVWAAIPIALAQIMAQYLWARERMKSILWAVPLAAIYVAMLFVFHDRPEQMILCLAAGGMLVLLWFVYAVVWLNKRVKLKYNKNRSN